MLYKKFQSNITELIGKSCFTDSAVAVSGGADSLALLSLMSIWAKENRSKLIVMTVDHNLRPESKVECQYVRNFSQSLGHDCITFSWDHQNNLSNIQARAREGRYHLMTDACNKLSILNLVTAHHFDDEIENFCIKQERKSGILGLSSSNINFYNNIRIIRPLFNIHKQELVDYLIANNIKWFEDESNASSKYQRNRIRLFLSQNENSKKEIILQQLKVNDQAEQLKHQLIAAIAHSVSINDFGFAKINLLNILELSKEIRLQLINFVLTVISGNKKVPRFRSATIILAKLEEGSQFINTLHGCIIKKIQDTLLIYREFGKNHPNNVILTKDVIWDSRFRFFGEVSKDKRGAYITNLSMADYVKIKDNLDLRKLSSISINNHKAILFTLPVIKVLEKIIAIPHISYYNDESLIDKFKIAFWPSFASRFTHFC